MNLDVTVLVKNEGLSEAGEPLPKELRDTISRLAIAGWWPLDFGECDGEGFVGYTELLFVYGPEIAEPDGWLWLSTTAPAFNVSARLTTSRG